MTVYYVDDGGSATAPYDTWAKAATSLSALDDAVAFASGDIVYIGHDHVCQFVHAASRVITGPIDNPPVSLISATQGSSPPTYQASATKQIDTTEGAYSLTFDGAFAMYGVCMSSGDSIIMASDTTETIYGESCTFKPADNKLVQSGANKNWFRNCTIDCAADTVARSTNIINDAATYSSWVGLTLVNVSNRTGTAFAAGFSALDISGGDFTGLTNATLCELSDGLSSRTFANCKTASTWAPMGASSFGSQSSQYLTFMNCGPADAPTYLVSADQRGKLISSSSIYRTNGATIEGDATAWLITTNSLYPSEGSPFYTPWFYGVVDSTGSKTFDCYITNDTADFTDAQVWLEVEYLATADDAKWSLATDQRATITTTAAAQTDDVTSTWNGTGPAFTYKQKLSVTATVNETGQFRCRVAVGVASIAGSRFFYVDPDAQVT